MSIKTNVFAAAIAAICFAGDASANTLSVVSAECATDAATTTIFTGAPNVACGGTGPGVNRTLSSNVNLGAADGAFYSLGLNSGAGSTGGGIVFEIAPAFSGTAMFVEVTNPSNHFEAAAVFAGTSSDVFSATYFGTVDNGAAYTVPANNSVTIAGGPWTHLFLLDVSRQVYGSTASSDGYDLDAITLAPAPIPLPAGAILLGTGLLLLGTRRRQHT